MVVPVGSLGDILAIIDVANKIRKALSSKKGSTKRYRDLLSELERASLIFDFARTLVNENAGCYAPQFWRNLQDALFDYGTVLAEIYREIEPYTALSVPLVPHSRSGSERMKDAGDYGGLVDGRSDGSASMTRILSWRRLSLQNLTWAFVKEKDVKEKMELLKQRRENMQVWVQFSQLYVS